jgi:hypothetical protein
MHKSSRNLETGYVYFNFTGYDLRLAHTNPSTELYTKQDMTCHHNCQKKRVYNCMTIIILDLGC